MRATQCCRCLSASLRREGPHCSAVMTRDMVAHAVGLRETDSLLALLRAKEASRGLNPTERTLAVHCAEYGGVEAALPSRMNSVHQTSWPADYLTTTATGRLPMLLRMPAHGGLPVVHVCQEMVRRTADDDERHRLVHEMIDGLISATQLNVPDAPLQIEAEAIGIAMALAASCLDASVGDTRKHPVERVGTELLQPLCGTDGATGTRGRSLMQDPVRATQRLETLICVAGTAPVLNRVEWYSPLLTAIDGLDWRTLKSNPKLARRALSAAERLRSAAAELRPLNAEADNAAAQICDTCGQVAADQIARLTAAISVIAIADSSGEITDKCFTGAYATLPDDVIASLRTCSVHVAAVVDSNLDRAVDVLRRIMADLPRVKATVRDGLLIADMHAPVVEELCRRGSPQDLTTAYTLLNAHKYYGLRITQSLILPLLTCFANTGDSRLFNLVDVCTLFSGCAIDARTIALMVRCCRIASDHHRAKALMELLRDDSAGILAKIGPGALDDLRHLKVLPPIPTSWMEEAT
jgi:hypothetical protein